MLLISDSLAPPSTHLPRTSDTNEQFDRLWPPAAFFVRPWLGHFISRQGTPAANCVREKGRRHAHVRIPENDLILLGYGILGQFKLSGVKSIRCSGMGYLCWLKSLSQMCCRDHQAELSERRLRIGNVVDLDDTDPHHSYNLQWGRGLCQLHSFGHYITQCCLGNLTFASTVCEPQLLASHFFSVRESPAPSVAAAPAPAPARCFCLLYLFSAVSSLGRSLILLIIELQYS